MKRDHFIRELVNAGCYLKRHGKKHDIYANPRANRLRYHVTKKSKRALVISYESNWEYDVTIEYPRPYSL